MKETTRYILEKNRKIFVRIAYTEKNSKRREVVSLAANWQEGKKLKQIRDELGKTNREELIEGSRLLLRHIGRKKITVH